MLKKAGIVVATAAVGLLAVSPLAFAGTSGKDHGYSHSHGEDIDVASSSVQKDSQGLINALNNPNVTVSPQVCNIDVLSKINALSGAVALLGFADDSDTNTETDACTQANVGGDSSPATNGG